MCGTWSTRTCTAQHAHTKLQAQQLQHSNSQNRNKSKTSQKGNNLINICLVFGLVKTKRMAEWDSVNLNEN